MLLAINDNLSGPILLRKFCDASFGLSGRSESNVKGVFMGVGVDLSLPCHLAQMEKT